MYQQQQGVGVAGQLIFIANHWQLTSLSAKTVMVPVDDGELKCSWRERECVRRMKKVPNSALTIGNAVDEMTNISNACWLFYTPFDLSGLSIFLHHTLLQINYYALSHMGSWDFDSSRSLASSCSIFGHEVFFRALTPNQINSNVVTFCTYIQHTHMFCISIELHKWMWRTNSLEMGQNEWTQE